MKTDVFAAVMATGIMSVAAADHGCTFISVPLSVLAAVALPALMYLTVRNWRSFSFADFETVIGLFTYVAACSVLAVRFDEHPIAVWVLGAMALQGWLSLMPVVIGRMWRFGWAGLRDRARGKWELASVATSGLSLVCSAAGIMFWATVFWVFAVGVYCVMTALIGWRALHEEAVRRDVPSDHWILMGAAAIATLAGEHIHEGLPPGPAAEVVYFVTIVTLGVATVQIVPLVIMGWRKILDWPAVFPLGMYSAATHAMVIETGWDALAPVSLVFFWMALTLWAVTAARWRLAGVPR